jgi:hypothetical protein
MASKSTPSPRAAATKASGAWLREQAAHERAHVTATEPDPLALAAGTLFARLPADPNDRLPSAFVPLLP